MAVRTRDEIIELVRGRIGDDTSDEALALLEDVTDTMDDFVNRANDPEKWRERYNKLDQEWRQRYRDRFTDDSVNLGSEERKERREERKERREDGETILTYEDLFKEV